MKRDEPNDTDKSSDIAKARALVKQAAMIVQRGKISERAAKFLKLADMNFERPGPLRLSDFRSRTIDDGIDIGNVYVDLNEACELIEWSRTTIRRMVNENILPQQHRGLYRLKDLIQCKQEYEIYGVGKP